MITKEEIDKLGLTEAFNELVNNEAYIFVKRRFDEDSLLHSEGDLQLMAEKFISQSGSKKVFRVFETYNSPHSGIVDESVNALLEPEYEDFDHTQ